MTKEEQEYADKFNETWRFGETVPNPKRKEYCDLKVGQLFSTPDGIFVIDRKTTSGVSVCASGGPIYRAHKIHDEKTFFIGNCHEMTLLH